MNYKKIYDDLMSSRLELKTERIELKRNGHYFEGHHIIPKCKGGDGISIQPNKSNNIVLLSPREHFLSHWLLWKIYQDRQMALAFHKMTSSSKNLKRISSSIGYEEARNAFRLTNIGNKYGKGVKKIITDEQKKKQSIKMKGKYIGEKNPFYKKTHTKESKDKIKESRKDFNKEKIWNYKGKRVLLNGDEVIKIFDTNKEISDYIGCTEGNIRAVLNGKQKTAKGYRIIYDILG